MVHPIEQLRYVARASGADAGLLVEEAASALGVFRNDPAALVTASRRLLTRQPAVGPLWWLCGRLVMSADSWAEGRAVVAELRSDQTIRHLMHGLPDDGAVALSGWPDTVVAALTKRGDVFSLVVDVEGQGSSVVRRLERSEVEAEEVDAAHAAGAIEDADLVLIEAAACGSSAALCDVGSLVMAATARALNTPTWLVVPVGRQLPEPYWQAIAERTVDTDIAPWLAPFEVVSFGLIDRVVSTDGIITPAEIEPSRVPVATELLRELV